MKPELWGQYLWKSIHFIALGYPDNPSEQELQAYKYFYSNLWQVIPCLKCANNYKRHLEELPIDDFLTSKKDLFEWTVNLHNIVNKELGKPIMSKEIAFALYTMPTKNFNITTWSVVLFIVAIIFVTLVLLLK